MCLLVLLLLLLFVLFESLLLCRPHRRPSIHTSLCFRVVRNVHIWAALKFTSIKITHTKLISSFYTTYPIEAGIRTQANSSEISTTHPIAIAIHMSFALPRHRYLSQLCRSSSIQRGPLPFALHSFRVMSILALLRGCIQSALIASNYVNAFMKFHYLCDVTVCRL